MIEDSTEPEVSTTEEGVSEPDPVTTAQVQTHPDCTCTNYPEDATEDMTMCEDGDTCVEAAGVCAGAAIYCDFVFPEEGEEEETTESPEEGAESEGETTEGAEIEDETTEGAESEGEELEGETTEGAESEDEETTETPVEESTEAPVLVAVFGEAGTVCEGDMMIIDDADECSSAAA